MVAGSAAALACGKDGQVGCGDTEAICDILPEYLTRRFVSAEQDAVLVSGRVPDVDASQLLPVIESLDKALDAVRAKHSGYKMAVTGLSAIAARNSALMINKLNIGLTLEFLFVATFIGLAFRRHAGEHPAWHNPDRTFWNGVVDPGRGPAVRKRRGVDGIFRIRDSLLGRVTARGGTA
jgi:hypothetical protein